ncbi:MAG: hypothetical protein QOE58_2632 [Actinomycetota bacterium]|nr:hypothetical protein [Actinomycetota bacterium]
MVLQSIVIDHDSGDIEEYKRRIAQAVMQAASTGAGSIGVPAEAVASNYGWISDACWGIVNVVSGWLGADDDPYTVQAIRVSGKDMLTAFAAVTGTPGEVSPFAPRLMVRDDTPGVKLKYNIDPVVLSGTDQGGDRGEYALYYRIELFVDGTKVY